MINILAEDVYFVFPTEMIIRCDILHWGQSRPSLVSVHSLQYRVKHRTHLYKGISISSARHRGHIFLSKGHLLSYEHFSAVSKKYPNLCIFLSFFSIPVH